MSKNKHYEEDIVVKGGHYTGYQAFDKDGNNLSGAFAYDTHQEAHYHASKNNEQDSREKD